ncbi:hypothetical protein JOC36_000767 [Weissella uvarum]|uniref:hypothetical protein n=1 Tax=Weissella uvarum TaxID=1479233 RepID=UPI00195F3041|nr:hypothetical protein [Weissella uvarum]MBM7617218.1 hypothetical protein [Weissella uvarum]MCM0595511.1 hypothetical protein [Weissella uvarum]
MAAIPQRILITNGSQAEMVQLARQQLADWQATISDPGKIWAYEENDDTAYAMVTALDNPNPLAGLVPVDGSAYLNQLINAMQPNTTKQTQLILIDDYESTAWPEMKTQLFQRILGPRQLPNVYAVFIDGPHHLFQPDQFNFDQIIDAKA